MVGRLVRSESTQQILSNLVWKLYNRIRPSTLTSVFQQIERWKGNKTLRSAERVPTLSTR